MKPLPFLALFALLHTTTARAQFGLADVQFWTGSGPDSSVLVIDFQNGAFMPCYAWGYLHDGTATAEDMLNEVAAWDNHLLLDLSGGSLNQVSYISGDETSGGIDQWFTWSGTDIATMTMNGGIAEPLSNGEWFGCSFTAIISPVAPGEPQPALDPYRFTFADVEMWVGSGPDSAVMVIDFQDGSAIDSYAWGYLFTTSTYGSIMLTDIAAADPLLDATFSGGWVSAITYNGHIGVAMNPYDWSYWEGFSFGGMYISPGIDPFMFNGFWFGCSYTDFAPVLRPGYPSAASGSTSTPERPASLVEVYPQPATDVVYVNTGSVATTLTVFDATGRHMHQEGRATGLRSIDVGAWSAGLYLLDMGGVSRTIAVLH